MRSIAAELLVIRKRTSTWILMGAWVLLGLMFAYLLPYLAFKEGGVGQAQSIETLMPADLVRNLLVGFPFFGGVFALMLGVLSIGSDYSWGTLKTLMTQGPGRMQIFRAKLIAIGVALVPFVLAIFAAGAVASSAIAGAENAPIEWPSGWLLIEGLGAGWLILGVWSALGVLIAALSRGTALAIGLGVLYTLVVEGILSGLASQVGWLNSIVEYSLRANAYSLVTAIGVPTEALADNGPGGFFGPFVDGGQAMAVLGAYVAVFVVLSAFAIRRRDVS